MNNISITHELCAEDRARLDRLTAALEALQSSTLTTSSVVPEVDLDQVQMKLAEAMAKASDHAEPPKNTTEEAETSTPSTTQAEEEKPVVEEITPAEEAKPTVTLDQIQQKVVQLAACNGGAKKAKVRAIINAHGARVSDLKEKPEAWAEVWEQLTALEKGRG